MARITQTNPTGGGTGGAVASVNSQTGAVILAASDVGADASGAAAAAQAFAVQRANHTGTQAASTITGLAAVATSGAYSDLSGLPAKTKRVTMPISGCGGTSNATTYSDVNQRSIILLPVTTTRWRLRVQNASAAGNTLTTGAYTLADTYVGVPNYNSDGGWTGAFLTGTTPIKALSGTAAPTDGTEYISAWVTDPTMQFTADTPGQISWGFTCTLGQSLVSDANRVALLFSGTGVAAKTGQIAAPTGSPAKNVALLDVRVEYETITALPVVLYLGDSTTAGQVDDDTLTPLGPGPHSPFPGAASLRNRHLAINAGIGGAPALTLYGRATTAVQWTRFDLATTVPDACVISIGINDVNVGTALATFRNRLGAIRSFVKTNFGIGRHLITTVMVQPRWAGGTITAGATSGATTLTTSASFTTGTVLDVGYGTANYEQLTTTGASTGAGPYTTTFTAATAHAHKPGETVAVTQESLRQDYNAAITEGIQGLEEVVDFAQAIRPTEDLTRLWGVGTIHPGSRTYKYLGAMVRV